MKLSSYLALLSICVPATAWPETEGTITGRVVDSAGTPVASVKVDIEEIGKVKIHSLHYGR